MRNTRAVSRMPLAIDGHVGHLAADFSYPASVLVREEKDPPFAPVVLIPTALGAVCLLARLDYFCALPVRTLHRDIDQLLPPRTVVRRGPHIRKLLI